MRCMRCIAGLAQYNMLTERDFDLRSRKLTTTSLHPSGRTVLVTNYTSIASADRSSPASGNVWNPTTLLRSICRDARP
ncbi:hypothetical protein CCM_07454 [Cordyceps militaris CM01]|uniref:Uncharacterized protein n=1 Tax=Cordyceps militaris (strain CM01) TaxID=983644 RepID=G3JPV1_CORMM|nr:uncharacterized protein CCM_07454 [Cordyceps militaris CM01]EGX89202.1 hypothetical protein CCM_07454 [Cordyceps militaris CM01]